MILSTTTTRYYYQYIGDISILIDIMRERCIVYYYHIYLEQYVYIILQRETAQDVYFFVKSLILTKY